MIDTGSPVSFIDATTASYATTPLNYLTASAEICLPQVPSFVTRRGTGNEEQG